VRYVFGNPGTTELPLMDQFSARSEIEYILALHEDSALGIAIGYAEATGKPAVVNLHTNPGLAHALGNLYNAYRAGTPLIVTAGHSTYSPGRVPGSPVEDRRASAFCRHGRAGSTAHKVGMGGEKRGGGAGGARSRIQDRADSAHRAHLPVASGGRHGSPRPDG